MANYIFSLCPILQWSQCIYHVHMHNITFPCPSKIGLSDFLFFFQSEHSHFRGMAFSPLARIKLDISIFLLCIFPLHICLFARQASCPICLKLDFLIFSIVHFSPAHMPFYAVGIFSVCLKLDISIFSKVHSPMHLCLFRGRHLFLSVSNQTFFLLFYRALLMTYAYLTRQAFFSLSQIGLFDFFLKCTFNDICLFTPLKLSFS